jgi:hypothetical protein
MSSSASCRAWLPPDWFLNLFARMVLPTRRSDWRCVKRKPPSLLPERRGPHPQQRKPPRGLWEAVSSEGSPAC